LLKWRPIQRNNVPHQGGINHQGMIQVGFNFSDI